MKRNFLYFGSLIVLTVFCALSITQFSCQKPYVAPPPVTDPNLLVGRYTGTIRQVGGSQFNDKVFITLGTNGTIIINDSKLFLDSMYATVNVDTFTIPDQTVANDTGIYSGRGIQSRTTGSLNFKIYRNNIAIDSFRGSRCFSGDPTLFIGRFAGNLTPDRNPVTPDTVDFLYSEASCPYIIQMVDKALGDTMSISIYNNSISVGSQSYLTGENQVTIFGSGNITGGAIGDSLHFNINEQEYNHSVTIGTFSGAKIQ